MKHHATNGETLAAETEGKNTNITILEEPNKITETLYEITTETVEADKAVSNTSASLSLNNEYETMGMEALTSKSGNENVLPALPALLGSYTSDELSLMFPDTRDLDEVVIGVDNRVRINPTTSYPWRAICALRITARNGQRYIGTGWLVGPRTVITAGHCVYMHNEGGWASSIEVIPALNDASRPYGSCKSSNLRSVTGWTNDRNRDNDYGAIILPTNCRLGDTVGYFGFAVRNDSFLLNAALNLSGYPADKGGNQQWWMAQKPNNVSSRVITYQIDTFGGQSGSPVWVLQNGQRYGVGIHTNGANSGNSATRIVQAVYDNILNWKNEGL